MARIIISTLSIVPLLFLSFSLLSHQTMSQPDHLYTFCGTTQNFTQNSLYETNRRLLLVSLSEASSLVPYFESAVGLSPDTVHGMFLCRGDINTTSCSECVKTAALEIATNCTLNERAVIYYEECMVRYSNVSFLSQLEIGPGIIHYSLQNATDSERFNQTLTKKFSELARNVSSSSLIPYFVEDKELVTHSKGSYELKSMVQCSPDLDLLNCTTCLRFAFLRVSTCCGSPIFSQIFIPKCLLRYETTVLSSPPPPPGPRSPPPLSPSSPPPESSPATSEMQPPPPPPPLVFMRPPNVSSGVQNKIFVRIIAIVTVMVFAFVDL